MTESYRRWDFALDQPGSAGPATLRYGAGFAAIIIAATVATMAFRHLQLAVFPQFATFHAGFILVVDGIAAFLLFGQFLYRPLALYALLGAAYLFNALVVIPFLLSFPGGLKAESVVIGGSQSAIWIWHAWHIVFPVMVGLSLLAHGRTAGRPVRAARVVPYIGWVVATAVVLASLVTLAVTVFHDHLPVLITPTRVPHTSTFYAVGGTAAALTAFSLVLSLRGVRRRSVLHVWIAVALLGFLGDAVVSLAGTGRYTVGWYFGRVASMVSAAILLMVFLGQINLLYRRLAETINDLFTSNRKLAALVEEKEALVGELRRRKEEIRQLAYIDPVTGLPNRRMLMDWLNHILAQAARHEHSTALLFLDLDKFKEVNDQCGHETGDKLLQEVGSRLMRCVRSGDTVSRLGGDEFVIALPEITRLEEVEATAEKIIRILGEPIPIAGHLLQVTASVGIAISKPEAQFDATELLARADVAMYAAKKAGRNRYALSG